MNNTSITKFRWSQKTDSILNKLGIFTIADFEGISLKALKEMGIPEKTIKQIEDICKVHNIETKETSFSAYKVVYEYEFTKEMSGMKAVKGVGIFDTTNIDVSLYSITSTYIATSEDAIEKYIKEECTLHGYVYKSMKIIDVMLLTDNCIDVGSHNRKYIKTIKSDRREVKRI